MVEIEHRLGQIDHAAATRAVAGAVVTFIDARRVG